MNRCRPFRVPLAVVLGAVLVLALVAGGVHHHSDFGSDSGGAHPCGICSLSHAPAAPVTVAVAPVRTYSSGRVCAIPAAAPHAADLRTLCTRGPPAA